MLQDLIPWPEKGDSVMDGRNSFYRDSIGREKDIYEKGIFFPIVTQKSFLSPKGAGP